MNNAQIIYPAIAMFALSISCVLYLGLSRFLAIHRGEVSIGYFSTYIKGSQPARLHLLARHAQNHFEVPPLFHISLILIFVNGPVTATSVLLAWLFVGARVVHTAIHLGSNNVSIRFAVFGFSLLCLCGLWGTLLVELINTSS